MNNFRKVIFACSFLAGALGTACPILIALHWDRAHWDLFAPPRCDQICRDHVDPTCWEGCLANPTMTEEKTLLQYFGRWNVRLVVSLVTVVFASFALPEMLRVVYENIAKLPKLLFSRYWIASALAGAFFFLSWVGTARLDFGKLISPGFSLSLWLAAIFLIFVFMFLFLARLNYGQITRASILAGILSSGLFCFFLVWCVVAGASIHMFARPID